MNKREIQIKVVSLFDGVSCGHVALDRAGIAVSLYEAFETDKYAKAISRCNYPDIRQHGDVLTADFSRFAGYDLVMGGSPCTFWSIAKTNREVDRTGVGWKLFMRFALAVRQIKPRYFLYENVASMPSNIKSYISEELGCEPILINSALVSAQHRKRLYWTNIEGLTQPDEKGILLKDILETGLTAREKSYCIDACYYKGGSKTRLDNQSGKRQMIYEPVAFDVDSRTLLMTRRHEENTMSDEIGAAIRTRNDKEGSFKRLEVRGDGKLLNALTTVQTDSVVCSPIRAGSPNADGQYSRIYSIRGNTVSLINSGGGHGGKVGQYKINLPDGDYTVRKLTPIEAERCQTLNDDYTAMGVDDTGKTVRISNTQRYKCIGNGWTADVIAHILGFTDLGEERIKNER